MATMTLRGVPWNSPSRVPRVIIAAILRARTLLPRPPSPASRARVPIARRRLQSHRGRRIGIVAAAVRVTVRALRGVGVGGACAAGGSSGGGSGSGRRRG